MATSDLQFRQVIFDEVNDPQAVRDQFGRVTGTHPTDAMQWDARLPGVWPRPLTEAPTREMLDTLYGVTPRLGRNCMLRVLTPFVSFI